MARAAGTGAASRRQLHDVGKPGGMFCFLCVGTAALRQQFHWSQRHRLMCSAPTAGTLGCNNPCFLLAQPGLEPTVWYGSVGRWEPSMRSSRRELHSCLGVTLRCLTIPIRYLQCCVLVFFSFNQPRIVFLFPLLWLCFCVEGNSAAAPGVMERCLQELLLLLSVKTPPVCA